MENLLDKKYDIDQEQTKHNITIEINKDKSEEVITDVKITLLTHYFNHSDKARQIEFDSALIMNLKNNFVKEVIIFMKDESTIISDDIPTTKIKIIKDNKWSTYKDMIEYANKNCKGLIGLIHLDCYLYDKCEWEILYTKLYNKKIMYALSCYETNMKQVWKNNEQSNTLYAYKQDSWIFISPLLLTSNIPDIQFGSINAGSAFAYHMINNEEYSLYNYCNSYKIMHLDNFIKSDDKKKKEITIGEYYALPDYENINNVSIDFLVNKLNISDEEIYKIKCQLLSKFMKLK